MSNELKMLENELVPVYVTDAGEKVVIGTELHRTLEISRDFSTWVKGRFAECDAIENKDFSPILGKSTGGRPSIEYVIRLDTAKEMAMLERNEMGKQVRRYFIQVENKYKELSQILGVDKGNVVSFKEQVECVEIIANMLNTNDAGKLLMIDKLYKCFNEFGFSPIVGKDDCIPEPLYFKKYFKLRLDFCPYI